MDKNSVSYKYHLLCNMAHKFYLTETKEIDFSKLSESQEEEVKQLMKEALKGMEFTLRRLKGICGLKE